jgi:hypothetical protein
VLTLRTFSEGSPEFRGIPARLLHRAHSSCLSSGVGTVHYTVRFARSSATKLDNMGPVLWPVQASRPALSRQHMESKMDLSAVLRVFSAILIEDLFAFARKAKKRVAHCDVFALSFQWQEEEKKRK